MSAAPHDPAVTHAARGGLHAFGALWIALGAAIAIGALDIGISDPTSAAVVGALLGADGAAFVLAAGLFRRRGAWLDVAVAALVAVNLLLTTTDQVGLLDLAALVLLGGLLVLIAIGIRGGRPA